MPCWAFSADAPACDAAATTHARHKKKENAAGEVDAEIIVRRRARRRGVHILRWCYTNCET